jgi:hypothetical protein
MNQDERLNRDRVPMHPRRWAPVSSAVGLTSARTATLGFVHTPVVGHHDLHISRNRGGRRRSETMTDGNG